MLATLAISVGLNFQVPDQITSGLIEHRKGFIGSVCGDKIIEIFGDPIDWDWVAIKIEPLIDDRELEILCIGNVDQLCETPIEYIGALPANDKAIDTSFLGLPNMLLPSLSCHR